MTEIVFHKKIPTGTLIYIDPTLGEFTRRAYPARVMNPIGPKDDRHYLTVRRGDNRHGMPYLIRLYDIYRDPACKERWFPLP